MRLPFFLIAMWLLTLPACEPCAECGEPLLFDPNVQMKFINRDSLLVIQDSLIATENKIDSLNIEGDSLSTKISEWASLINSLTDSIEDGKTQYISDTVLYDDSIVIAFAQNILVDTALVEENELKTFLTEIETTILSGNVRVDNLSILENSSQESYTDSALIYSFPLLMQGFDITTFAIDIEDKKDTISFSYTTDLFVDTQRRVEMRAFNIDTVSYTYDSLIFECNTSECLSNEVLVTVYF